jgi:hypothetical protein
LRKNRPRILRTFVSSLDTFPDFRTTPTPPGNPNDNRTTRSHGQESRIQSESYKEDCQSSGEESREEEVVEV